MEITKTAIFELKSLETTQIYRVQEFIASIVLGQYFPILFLYSPLTNKKKKSIMLFLQKLHMKKAV